MDKLIKVTWLLNLIDTILTLSHIHNNLIVELNPLFSTLVITNPGLFIIAKLLLVTGGLVLLYKYRDMIFAQTCIIIAFITYLFIFVLHIIGLLFFI